MRIILKLDGPGKLLRFLAYFLTLHLFSSPALAKFSVDSNSLQSDSPNLPKPNIILALSSMEGRFSWFKPKTGFSVQTVSIKRGVEYLQSNRLREAIREFRSLIENDPGNAEGHYYLGLVLLKQEKFGDAVPHFEKALKLDPELGEVNLNLGIVYYQTGKSKRAQEALKRAIEAQPENGSAHFFMGLALHSLEKYEESLIHINKAKKLDLEFRQIGLYYKGLAYFKMGKRQRARDLFERTVAYDPESDLAQSARDFIGLIEKPQAGAGKHFSFYGNAGWEHNDNITRTEQDTISNIEDVSWIYQAGVEYQLVKKGKFTLDAGYDFYQSLFEDAKEFDFQSHTGNLSAGYDFGNWDLGLYYYYSFNFLDEKSFLGINSISPNAGFSLHPSVYTTVNYNFQGKVLFTAPGRDATNHSLGFTNFYFFLDNQAYFSFGYQFSDEDTRDSQFDYAGHLATANLKLPVVWNVTFWASYQFSVRDYKSLTPSIGQERKDDKQTLNLILNKTFFENFFLKANYRRVMSSSNLESVDFTENALYFSLGFSN